MEKLGAIFAPFLQIDCASKIKCCSFLLNCRFSRPHMKPLDQNNCGCYVSRRSENKLEGAMAPEGLANSWLWLRCKGKLFTDAKLQHNDLTI